MKKVLIAVGIVLVWMVSSVVAWYGLNELTTPPAWNDQFVLLDVSDTSLAATGTQKYQTWKTMLRIPFLAKTSDYTLTAGDVVYLMTNFGASGTVTLTLPECTSANVGDRYSAGTVAAYQVRLDPNGNDSICDKSDGEAGEYVTMDSVKGSLVGVICLQETMSGTEADAYNWMTLMERGTIGTQD